MPNQGCTVTEHGNRQLAHRFGCLVQQLNRKRGFRVTFVPRVSLRVTMTPPLSSVEVGVEE